MKEWVVGKGRVVMKLDVKIVDSGTNRFSGRGVSEGNVSEQAGSNLLVIRIEIALTYSNHVQNVEPRQTLRSVVPILVDLMFQIGIKTAVCHFVLQQAECAPSANKDGGRNSPGKTQPAVVQL